jgi:hypothetical protein
MGSAMARLSKTGRRNLRNLLAKNTPTINPIMPPSIVLPEVEGNLSSVKICFHSSGGQENNLLPKMKKTTPDNAISNHGNLGYFLRNPS